MTQKTMKAAVLVAPEVIEIQDLPIPNPKPGQVLIKMAFAPINPSDLSFLTGNYGLKKEMPVVPGLEGSGTVISSGGGFLGKLLLNKPVACIAPNKGDGTWAEYMVANASQCVKLKKGVPLDQGSMFFVNPFTALAFLKMTLKGKYDAVLMTAAGSALADMTFNLLDKNNIPYLGIVRKDSSDLKNRISSSSEDFKDQLKAWAVKYKRVLFLDAVGGSNLPYNILHNLPAKSKMIIYGRLSFDDAIIRPEDFIFNDYTIQGFWLSRESQTKNLISVLQDASKVNKLFSLGFRTKVNKKISIEDIKQGLLDYENNMSGGKVLIEFS